MRSIRGSLFRWLFLGLGLLWVVAGISLYVMIRSGLQARFDADLSHLASAAPLIMPTGDRARSRGAILG